MSSVDKKQLSQMVSLIDLTSLNDDDSEASIQKFCQEANTQLGPVAAVCVYPRFIQSARTILGSDFPIASVVNFPSGNDNAQEVLAEIHEAVSLGADEIDMVIPYQDCLKGELESSIQLVKAAKIASEGRPLKVILETGVLVDENLIYRVSLSMLRAGADFLKTSTGKVKEGASLSAATAMLEAIYEFYLETGEWRGFKASGGIRDLAQAESYMELADHLCGTSFIQAKTFRLGASSLLKNILGHEQSGQGY